MGQTWCQWWWHGWCLRHTIFRVETLTFIFERTQRMSRQYFNLHWHSRPSDQLLASTHVLSVFHLRRASCFVQYRNSTRTRQTISRRRSSLPSESQVRPVCTHTHVEKPFYLEHWINSVQFYASSAPRRPARSLIHLSCQCSCNCWFYRRYWILQSFVISYIPNFNLSISNLYFIVAK